MDGQWYGKLGEDMAKAMESGVKIIGVLAVVACCLLPFALYGIYKLF